MTKLIDREALPESLKDGYARAVSPFIRLLTRWDMHPNTFTVFGLIVSAAAAVFMAVGSFRIAASLVLLAGFFDTVDGKLARQSGKVTKFGALLDSTLDRYSEVLLFFGMAYFFIEHDRYLTSVAVAVALGGSLMVSYVRARAESLGFDCRVGILQRPERLILIAAGGMIHPAALVVSIWIIAVLANVTAFIRLLHVRNEDRNNTAASSP
jgi:CDP-diacylglycerol---glycerol-3-phosphate 3-phosphatidyltransferase